MKMYMYNIIVYAKLSAFVQCNSSLEGAMELIFAPFCSSCDALSPSFLAEVKNFRFWLKTMDYSKAFRSNFCPPS